jgi:hypothetical protein
LRPYTSRELIEAVTDSSGAPVWPTAWFDPQPRMAEIGDICVSNRTPYEMLDG